MFTVLLQQCLSLHTRMYLFIIITTEMRRAAGLILFLKVMLHITPSRDNRQDSKIFF